MAIMGSPIFLLVCLIPLYGVLAAPNVIRPSFSKRTIVFPDTKSKCEVLDGIINGNYSNGNSGSGIDYDGEIVVRVLTTRAHTEEICAMMYNATQAFCRLVNAKQSMMRLKQVKSQFKSRFGITDELCEDLNKNERLPTFAESARHDDAKKIASLIFCQLRLKIIDEKQPICSYFASPNVRPSSDSFSLSRVRRSETNENATNEAKIATNVNSNESLKNESALINANKNDDGKDNSTPPANPEEYEDTAYTSKLPESQDSVKESNENGAKTGTESLQADEDSSQTIIIPSMESATNDTTSTPNSPQINHHETTSTDPTSTVMTVEGNDEYETDEDDEDDLTFGPRIDNGPIGPKPDGWQKHSFDDNDDDEDDNGDDTQNHVNSPTNDGLQGKTFKKNEENIPANGGPQETTSTINRENLPTNDGLQGTTSTMVPPTNAAGTLLGTYTTQSIIFGLLLAHVNLYMIFNSIS